MAQLEDYFDRQSDLPNEVCRNLRLMRELDDKIMQGMQKIELLQKQYEANKKENIKKEITKQYNDNINIAKEKLVLADKIYQTCDKAVLELDEGLKKFEDNIKNSLAPDHKKRFQLLSKYQKERRKKINQEIEQSKEIFQTGAGQSEPMYCFCVRPSFGAMIMCDNQSCKREWFHIECVKLDDYPEENEKWFCSKECRREAKNRAKK
ncbi:hypothetical protein pb186bvf_007733 [Paramecium bursaria]